MPAKASSSDLLLFQTQDNSSFKHNFKIDITSIDWVTGVRLTHRQTKALSNKALKTEIAQKTIVNKKIPLLPNIPSEIQIKVLKPVKLNDIKRLIERNNSEMKAISSRLEQAKSRLLSTLSIRYPTLDLNANGIPQYLSGTHKKDANFSNTPTSYSNEIKASVSTSLKWDIIDPTRSPEINSAKMNFEKAQNIYYQSLNKFYFKALSQYTNLQQLQQKLLIAEKSLLSSKSSLDDVRLRNKALVATDLEVLEAESQQSRDGRFLNDVLSELTIARRSLSNTLGLAQNVTATAESNFQIMGDWNYSLHRSIVDAFNNRTELKNSLIDIDINKLKAKKSSAEKRPIISLINTLSYSLSRGQTEVLAPDYDNNENDLTNVVGLTAKWRLFDGNKSKNLSSFYMNKANESKYNLINERNKVREEVEESYYKLESALNNIQTTQQDVIKQRRILSISKHRFKAGVTNQREVVNNQRDLKQAEVNYINSISNYNNNYLQLLYKTGKSEIIPCPKVSKKDSALRINLNKSTSACEIELLALESFKGRDIHSFKESQLTSPLQEEDSNYKMYKKLNKFPDSNKIKKPKEVIKDIIDSSEKTTKTTIKEQNRGIKSINEDKVINTKEGSNNINQNIIENFQESFKKNKSSSSLKDILQKYID